MLKRRKKLSLPPLKNDPDLQPVTENDIHDWLSGVTYKPGTFFYAPLFRSERDDTYTIRWCLPARNSLGRHEPITVTATTTIDLSYVTKSPRPKETFLQYVYNILESAEVHECQEWFKVNGKAIYDPHKEVVT